MLLWTENLIALKMGHDVAGDDMLHQFAGYAGEGDGAVVGCVVSLSLFEDRCDVGLFPVLWQGTRGV